ncbi:MAG: hypothetical protein PHV02_08695 [Rhodocyclaceae bacterium]|nr:hypothetical protein [Rhodocyclaceae bacterium]
MTRLKTKQQPSAPEPVELLSWMYGDPALFLDRKRAMDARVADLGKIEKERHRIRQARKWRKLVKLAQAGKLKGQSNAR